MDSTGDDASNDKLPLTVDLVHLFLAVAHQSTLDPVTRDVSPTEHHVGVPSDVDQKRFAVEQLIDEQIDVVSAEFKPAL